MFLWLLFFYQLKVILKPDVIKSSNSCKKYMAECQARKRALENVDQSQEHRLADSNAIPIKRPLKLLKNPRDASRKMLNITVLKNSTELLLL